MQIGLGFPRPLKFLPPSSFASVDAALGFFNELILDAANGVSCFLYVDDFALYLSCSTLPSAVRRMQLAINRVADWTDSHGFRFSVEKSHAVLFRRGRRVFPEPSLTLYDREVRLLGMIFDERLTWFPHLRSLCLACQSPLDLLTVITYTYV